MVILRHYMLNSHNHFRIDKLSVQLAYRNLTTYRHLDSPLYVILVSHVASLYIHDPIRIIFAFNCQTEELKRKRSLLIFPQNIVVSVALHS